MEWLEAQPHLWVVVPGVCVVGGGRKQLPRFKISGKGALEMPRTSLDVPDMTVPVLLAQGSPNGVCS